MPFFTLLLTIIITATSFGVGATPATTTSLSNVIQLELNTPFFDQLGREVHERSLQDIFQQKIPDERGESDGGIKYEINGNYFSTKFRELNIKTGDNLLELKVRISDVHLHVSELKAKKKFLKTTCRNIDIYIANQAVLPGRVVFTPNVAADKTLLNVASVDFTIPESQFEVVGPSSCSGVLGGIIKRKVRKLLVKQRAKVQQLVRQRLRQAATKMAERLSRKLQVAHEFKLGSLGDILDNSAVAQLALERLRLSEQGMMVQFAAGLPAASSTFNLTTLKDEFFNDNLTSDPSRWGFIGINPSLINALVQLAIPVRGEFRQLTGRGNLDIDAFFDADALSELIPDLMNLDGGQRSLQAHYRLLSSPQLGIDQSGLFLKLPTIELLLMVWYEDEWQPYYHFLIDLTPELSFVDQGGEIKLQVATTRDVMVRGGWERSFPIGRPDVNHQLFGDILKELLSMDDSLPILATFKKPKIEFDGVSLRSEAVVTPPFFGITLFK